MDRNHIATKQDVEELKNFLTEILKSVKMMPVDNVKSHPVKYIRTKQAKELLQVSTNKLKDMRLKNEVTWSYIGSLYYYDYESIIQTLDNNAIKISK